MDRKKQQEVRDEAREVCRALLKCAERQARKGEPRLLAEILSYLKPPQKITIIKQATILETPGHPDDPGVQNPLDTDPTN